ncbi:transcriptional regulator, partial [Streptomyces sp. NEAU-H3]|nr:transcriptional regulator [Streptomyces sp. NEAU-H3]
MPERNIEFGAYGAQGVKGHELVARRLDSLAGFIASPVTTRRGLTARLRYLTSSPRQLTAARAAGLTISARTIKAQLEGTRRPSARTLRQIHTAYQQVRRQNV